METYIVKKSDVGKGRMTQVKLTDTHAIYPFEPLGKVLACDVGKKLVRQNGIWYAENMEQFKKRTGQL